MPKSEAHLDDCAVNLRVRLPGFNDSVGGVRFANGAALDPMSPRTLGRLRGIGLALKVVGPWSETPAAPVEAPPSPDPTEPPASSPVAATQGATPKATRSRAPARSPR